MPCPAIVWCFSACTRAVLLSLRLLHASLSLSLHSRGRGASQPATFCSACQPAGVAGCPLHTPLLSALLFRLPHVFEELVGSREGQTKKQNSAVIIPSSSSIIPSTSSMASPSTPVETQVLRVRANYNYFTVTTTTISTTFTATTTVTTTAAACFQICFYISLLGCFAGIIFT